MTIEEELEAIHKHSATAGGYLVTMLTKRTVSRKQLQFALEHAQATVSRLELLISRLR